eukprot:4543543-Amphidinium_carterae.1
MFILERSSQSQPNMQEAAQAAEDEQATEDEHLASTDAAEVPSMPPRSSWQWYEKCEELARASSSGVTICMASNLVAGSHMAGSQCA